jgi:predicted ATPase
MLHRACAGSSVIINFVIMQIESIRLRNFKVYKDVELVDIPRLCILVGANGSGKSTLFDVFGFLKDCLTYNVSTALRGRGGFQEVVSRGAQNESISIEIQYRMPITGKERLVTYALEIGVVESKVCVKHEFLCFKRGQYGFPFHFLDFKNGSGMAVTNEEDFDKTDEDLNKEEQTLESKDILAIKGLGQFQRFKAAAALRNLIENWHVSDFHISMARGSKEATGETNHLSTTGDNLQLVARTLHDEYPEIFSKILDKMRQRVPGVDSINTEVTPDGRLLLKFSDGAFKDPFIDKFVSDGTIKMFAYLVLLHDPKPHPFLCIEEPENQLYPTLLEELAEEFRDYARRGGQVFVSTHSPDFLNAAQVDEVFWLEKEQGYSMVKRAKDDEQIVEYMKNGDKMGSLWKEGLFGRANP